MAKRVNKKVSSTDQPPSSTAQQSTSGIEEKIAHFFFVSVKPYARLILYGVLIVIVAGFSVFAVVAKRAENRAKAFRELASASSKTEIMEIAETYAGKAVGRVAAYRLARKYFEDGEYATAAQKYASFIANYPKADMVPQAKLGRAYALEADGRLEQAQNTFAELAASSQIGSRLQREAYVGAGRCAENRGDIDEAREYYQSAVDKRSEDMYSERAESALSRLASFSPENEQRSDAAKAADSQPTPEEGNTAK